MNINLTLTPAEALALKLALSNRIDDSIQNMGHQTRCSIFQKLPRRDWLESNQVRESPPPDAYEDGAMIPGAHQPVQDDPQAAYVSRALGEPSDPIPIVTPKAWWCTSHRQWAKEEFAGKHFCPGARDGILLPCFVEWRDKSESPPGFDLAQENGFPHHL